MVPFIFDLRCLINFLRPGTEENTSAVVWGEVRIEMYSVLRYGSEKFSDNVNRK